VSPKAGAQQSAPLEVYIIPQIALSAFLMVYLQENLVSLGQGFMNLTNRNLTYQVQENGK